MAWKSVQKKNKVMVNSNDSSLHADITLNDNKLEEANTLYYLGATLSNDGSVKLTSEYDFCNDTTICYMEQPTHRF